MKRPLCLAFVLIASLPGFFVFNHIAIAQSQSPAGESPTSAVTVMFAPLAYPPLARQARISGDVQVDVRVRPDGSVAEAKMFSGHPMLAPAAVENSRQSHYECNRCIGETEYRVTYTFGFIEDLTAYDRFEDRPVRAGKCLYFWKCGMVRVKTSDYCTAVVQPEITQSPGHVKLLVLPVCVETMYSASASR